MNSKLGIAELVEIFGKLDATDCSSEYAISQFMLVNMKEFRRDADKKAFIINALQAYAKLLQDHGVKV